jgi:hypothetical protein
MRYVLLIVAIVSWVFIVKAARADEVDRAFACFSKEIEKAKANPAQSCESAKKAIACGERAVALMQQQMWHHHIVSLAKEAIQDQKSANEKARNAARQAGCKV